MGETRAALAGGEGGAAMSKKLECCEAMKHAQEDGTDNEVYGKAVLGSWTIGTGLPDISFCPWCGNKVTQ